MKKFFTLIAAALIATAAMADNAVKMTFSNIQNANNDPANVTVNVLDGNGNAIEGAEAHLTKVEGTNTNFQTSGVCANGTLLGPADGFGHPSNDPQVTYTFTLNGVSGVLPQFNSVDLGVQALNSGGIYQGRLSNINYQFTLNIGESEFATVSSTFGDNSSIGGANSNTPNYGVYTLNGSDNSTKSLTFSVTIKKTVSNGCFFGLQDITFREYKGEFYTFRNQATESLMVAPSTEGGNVMSNGAAGSLSTLWLYKNNTLQSLTTGKYAGAFSEGNMVLADTTNYVHIIGSGNGCNIATAPAPTLNVLHSNKQGNHPYYIRTDGSNGAQNYTRWDATVVTEVTLPLNQVGDKYYGTLYLPLSVGIKNANVYTISAVNDGTATATLFEYNENGETILPAGLPVILVSDSANAIIALNEGTDDEAIPTLLKGYTFATQFGTEDYYLGGGNDGNTIGFYRAAEDISTNTIANKAYLPASALTTASAKGFKLVFGGDATGINSVKAAASATNDARYNLAGQRVSKDYKGVVIVNGKKVLVK